MINYLGLKQQKVIMEQENEIADKKSRMVGFGFSAICIGLIMIALPVIFSISGRIPLIFRTFFIIGIIFSSIGGFLLLYSKFLFISKDK
jgi:hypothetical protein